LLLTFQKIKSQRAPQQRWGARVYSYESGMASRPPLEKWLLEDSDHKRCSIRARRKTMKIKPIVLAAIFALTPSAAIFAQTTTPPATTPPPTINQRKTDQQERIGNGVKSGQLTARETGHLEHQEAGINKEERGMKAQDHGKLTKQDRKTIKHQQNQESKRIYRDKHNAARR
jgi:hypothetical protein